ncbi:hypothetical protein JTE90_028562 [Oedothorax gibbosus]|uniref:MoaB/Mog domain-containing protein n=1 Tax=Oedothorax gibbosus TaxID=931172 RepID=A0AAV6VUH5_9ARAC|nr:hypothetical protein JTE90_028562 [Oedothorax gibbosus]
MIFRNLKKFTIPGLFKNNIPGINFFIHLSTTSSSDITAGVLIIGDEILNGQTEDINSLFFIKNLTLSDIKIRKIAILPDNVDAISTEVSTLSKECTVVLTSGGIGPTHDDVTYEAVAKAFSENLALNPTLMELFRDYFGPSADQNEAVKKFSSIPQTAMLNFGFDKHGNKTRFPLISVKNTYMFPGVPMLLQRSFDVFKANFFLHNKPLYIRSIFITLDEFSITPVLNDAVRLFQGRVKFGSYPAFNEKTFKVKLILEGADEAMVIEASDYFNHKLPRGSILNLNYSKSSSDPEGS